MFIMFGQKKYKDGGLTDNMPCLDNEHRTIFVSPFSGRQHICPIDTGRFYVTFAKQDFKVSNRFKYNVTLMKQKLRKPVFVNLSLFFVKMQFEWTFENMSEDGL